MFFTASYNLGQSWQSWKSVCHLDRLKGTQIAMISRMDHDMKKNTSKQYAIALYETTKELSGRDLEQAIQNFVTLLVHDRKLRQADAIIREFEAYAKKQDGVVGIEITSARKLDKATLNLITKAFGEKVEAVESVDEGLIGGMRVKMEDRILDGSIRTHLMRLKQQLA